MEKQDLHYNIIKMLELKTMEIKLEIPAISINDITNYYLDINLKNKKINDLNEAAYNIFNIKSNRLIEYLNNKFMSDATIKLDNFVEMFEN